VSDSTKTPEEQAKESFERRSAVTVAILAAVCAFATLCASNTNSDVLLAATNAADQWAYFQSNSVKGHAYEVEEQLADMLQPGCVDEAKRKKFEETCAKSIAKYAEGKEKAKTEAEKQQGLVVVSARKNANYGVAALLLQVSIVVVSISILVRKNALWAGGTLVGLGGLAITLLTMLGFKIAVQIPY